jgi:hypothetical protein
MLKAKFARAFFLFLMTIVSTSTALSFSIPKASFEQKTGVLVWKMGNSKAQLDDNDDLTDLTKECDIFSPLKATQAEKLLEASPKNNQALHTSAQTLIRKLGLEKLRVRMNPVMAEVGQENKPIFLLFPEFHVNASTSSLRRSFANDLMLVTHMLDRRKIKILNTYEGVQDIWQKDHDFKPWTIAERNRDAQTLFYKHGASAARIIGEVYYDKIDTAYNDDNDLAIKNVLAISAYNNLQNGVTGDSSWEQSVKYLKRTVAGRLKQVDVEEYRSFYDDLLSFDLATLKKKPSELCEQRSSEMAKYTYKLARDKNAKVIYMTFGALHAHGVIEQIKKYSASFIVFSPNL